MKRIRRAERMRECVDLKMELEVLIQNLLCEEMIVNDLEIKE